MKRGDFKTVKRIVIAVLLLSMLVCLVGCSSVDYGTVKEKSFVPAHRTYQPMIIHISKSTRIIPRWVSHADSWSILVENEDGREWWSVTENYYNSVDVGDYVDRRKTSD